MPEFSTPFMVEFDFQVSLFPVRGKFTVQPLPPAVAAPAAPLLTNPEEKKVSLPWRQQLEVHISKFYAGNIAKFAATLGVSRDAVDGWLVDGSTPIAVTRKKLAKLGIRVRR